MKFSGEYGVNIRFEMLFGSYEYVRRFDIYFLFYFYLFKFRKNKIFF